MNTDIAKKVSVTVGADHRDGQGNLISRMVSIDEPEPINCLKPKCLMDFFLRVVKCGLLSTYHCKRVEYAERRRHQNIPMKYRTGEDSPETIKGLIWGIIKLKLRR